MNATLLGFRAKCGSGGLLFRPDQSCLDDRPSRRFPTGRRFRTVRALETALKLGPNRADAHYLIGRFYQKLGRTADFEREIQLSRRQRQQQLQQEESLLKAGWARGDATQVLELTPSR